MANTALLQRSLSYTDARGEPHLIEQSEILRLTPPLIVLGEPGSGKSTLLAMIAAQNGLTTITAKQLLRRTSLENHGDLVVIDALDEVATAREADAVQRVLEKLAGLGHPPFILSCRSADWQGAVASHDIEADYGHSPIILTIEPLNRAKAKEFLAARLDSSKTQLLIDHLESRSLESLYQNPLTLRLLADVADENDTLPDTRGQLFETACDLLWTELAPSHEGSALSNLTRDEAIFAAGAASAVQILTNADAISLRGAAQIEEGDRSIRIVERLPHGDPARAIIGSRLFVPAGIQRFAPLHRVIAEYLGARWLANLLEDGRSEKRIFSMLTLNGTVPASLRGIHAWIAYFSNLAADQVIENDPYGVLRYGDPSTLSVPKARKLLQALTGLSEIDPYFRSGDWGAASAKALARPELQHELEAILDTSDNFHLRKLILECITGSPIADALVPRLRALILNDQATFAERAEAAEAIVGLIPADEWPGIIASLRANPTEDSTRLALETLTQCDLTAFDDLEIVETMLAFLGYLVCPVDRSKFWTRQTVGSMTLFARKVPDSRLASILDLLAEYVVLDSEHDEWERRWELANFASRAIRHVLAAESVSPDRVWEWLQLLDRHHGRSRDDHQKLEAFFTERPALRRDVQRYALTHDESEKTLWMRSWRLGDTLSCLAMTSADATAFLEELAPIEEPTDRDRQDWQDLVQIARTRDGITSEVRAIARRFARGDKELLAFLRKAARPVTNKWEKRSQARQLKLEAEKQVRWTKHRIDFGENSAALRAGDLRWIVPAAQAYLGLFNDSNREKLPLDRVREWLGDDLADAAASGFEAALFRTDLPTATAVAQGFAKRQRWNMVYAIVAGLAERIRTERGLDDVPREVLRTGWITLHHESYLDDHLKIENFTEVLERTLAQDLVALAGDYRLLIEPQIQAKTEHIWGLYRLMRADGLRPIATALAEEWLERHPSLGIQTEIELVDHLLKANERSILSRFWRARLETENITEDRRLLWISTAFVVDFEACRAELESEAQRNPKLLWSLRSRLRPEERSGDYVGDPAQLGWLIETFRRRWLATERPNSVTSGESNEWDATEFLRHLIMKLASDVSVEAGEMLIALRDAPADDYTNYIRHAAALQRRARDEATFEPVTPERLHAVAGGESPRSIDDLQAALLDSLAIVQSRLRGSETNALDAFYEGSGRPKGENYCRDRIVEWISRCLPPGVSQSTEVRMPADKRSDIAFLSDGALVPVEIKPQWNSEVWDAAIDQLDALYSVEWRAVGRGIYLVLWFGPVTDRSKRLTSPPTGVTPPTTAEEFRALLHERIPEARRGQLSVVVLDLTR